MTTDLTETALRRQLDLLPLVPDPYVIDQKCRLLVLRGGAVSLLESVHWLRGSAFRVGWYTERRRFLNRRCYMQFLTLGAAACQIRRVEAEASRQYLGELAEAKAHFCEVETQLGLIKGEG